MGSEGVYVSWDGVLMYLCQPKVRASELFHLVILQVCVCLLLQDLLQSCSRGGEEESGGHVL